MILKSKLPTNVLISGFFYKETKKSIKPDQSVHERLLETYVFRSNILGLVFPVKDNVL